MVLSPVPSGLRSVWQQGHLLEATMAMADFAAAMPSDRSLLIVEDDKSFLQRLARAMEGRGFAVTTAESVAEGLTQLATASPAFAVVDMRLAAGTARAVLSPPQRPSSRGPRHHPDRLWQHRNRSERGETRRRGLSLQAGRRRRRGGSPA